MLRDSRIRSTVSLEGNGKRGGLRDKRIRDATPGGPGCAKSNQGDCRYNAVDGQDTAGAASADGQRGCEMGSDPRGRWRVCRRARADAPPEDQRGRDERQPPRAEKMEEVQRCKQIAHAAALRIE